MRVLVTGGAGFIGSSFLRRHVLARTEHHFVNVDKLTYAGTLSRLVTLRDAPNLSFEPVDIADAAEVERLFETYQPELVVHFAAETHVDRSIVGPQAFMRTNVEGTFQLLDACRRHWPRGHGLFHHVSTDEVYGSLGPTGVFTETSPYDPSSPYSASKAASDHLVRAYGRTYGLPVKLTCASNNYGPFQFPEKLIPLMIQHAHEGKPLPIYGDGLNVRDWIHVDDHSDAIWRVITSGAVGETYNIGAGEERTNLEVIDGICDAVSAATGVDACVLRDLKTFVPDRPGHDRRYALDTGKLRKDCGWAPTHAFEEGLEATVRWFLENQGWVDAVRDGEYDAWMATNYTDRASSGAGDHDGA